MKLFLLIGLLFINGNHLYTSVQIRELYHQGIENEKSANLLHDYFEANEPDEPLLMGYKGANLMVMAKFGFSPREKYNHFTSGKAVLEKAIGLAPANLELTYLRYTIQVKAPSFLQYNKALQHDRMALLAGAKMIKDTDLKKRIVSFLLVTGNLTSEEKNQLY